MSSSTSLRFSVTEGDKHASVWNIVVPKKKPEAYIFNSFLGSIHVSFHGSGKWHTKFGDIKEKQRVNLGPEVTDSYIEKWERPEELKPHVTVAFRIITPWGSVRRPKSKKKKPFIHVRNAEPGHNTEILVLFVSPGKELEVKNGELIGSITLCNGEQIAVVRGQIPLNIRPPELPKTISDFTDRVSLINLFRGNLGTIMHGNDSDGSRVMWDIAIRISPSGYMKIAKLKLMRQLRKLLNGKTN